MEEETLHKGNGVDRGNELRKLPNMYIAWNSSGWLNPQAPGGNSCKLRLER